MDDLGGNKRLETLADLRSWSFAYGSVSVIFPAFPATEHINAFSACGSTPDLSHAFSEEPGLYDNPNEPLECAFYRPWYDRTTGDGLR